MNLFYHSAFLKALGWSLIDSLWQMGLVWLLYILFTVNGKKLKSSSRYSLALLAIASGWLWFIASFGFNYYNLSNGRHVFGIAYFIENGLPFIDEQKWMPVISSLYIVTILFYASRWVFQFMGNRNLYNERLNNSDDYYESFINDLKQLGGVTRNIRFWISGKITTPLTFGFLKPVILLPVAALSQLTTKQVEALVVHEFYHIKRNDYLVNITLTICDMLLFFNPFAKLLTGNIRKERENCCDDEVIGLGYDRWEYAQALYILGKTQNDNYQFALAATGKGKQLLLQRVKRMLNRSHSSPSLLKPLSIFFLCLFIAGSMSRDLKKEPPQITGSVAKENTMIVFTRKDIVVESKAPVIKESKNTETKTVTIISDAEAPAPPPPPPALPVEEPVDHENLIVTSYSYVTSGQETVEFCLVEAPMDKVTKPSNGASHPYLPAATFYFPSHEMPPGPGKNAKTKTVQL